MTPTLFERGLCPRNPRGEASEGAGTRASTPKAWGGLGGPHPRYEIISGPTPLIGAKVRALDVRAGAALVLAGLVASG